MTRDATELARAVVRLVAAGLLGAVVGFQWEREGKAAGLRPHILVALGAALLWSRAPKPVDPGRGN